MDGSFTVLPFKACDGCNPAAKVQGVNLRASWAQKERKNICTLQGQKCAPLCHVHTRHWVQLLQALSLSSFGQTGKFHTEGNGSPAVNLQLKANSAETTDDGLKV